MAENKRSKLNQSDFMKTKIAGVIIFASGFLTQTVQSAALEEVVVTAQKREQSLQDVGISVTAFSGEQMKKLGFLAATDVVAHTPGLGYVSSFGEGNNASFTLRGVGLNDFSEVSESAAAVYVDEVYQATLAGLGFQLFDVERSEVLKGPQGTLFGRNATGGLVHFITKKPTEEFDAYSEITVGEYNQVRFEGAVGGSLTKTVNGRLSFLRHKHDGYRESRLPGVADGNETDMYALRGQLLFHPADSLDILLSAHYSDADQVASTYEHTVVDFAPDGVTKILVPAGVVNNSCGPGIGGPGLDCYGYRDTDGDVQASDNDREPFLELENSGGFVKVDYDFGSMELTSITAFEQVEKYFGEETDMGPLPGTLVTNPVDSDQFSQEIRLGGESDRLNWAAGFYYFDRDIKSGTRTDLSAPLPFNLSIGAPNLLATNRLETESRAVFGHLEYALNEQWALVGGIRYTEEESEYELQVVDEAPAVPIVAVDFSRQTKGDLAKHDNSNISFRTELDWRPNEDWLIYGAISRGVKGAGFNTNLGFSDTQIPYDEETLTAYELGFKSTLLDGSARFNASMFYYDYEDYQAFSFQGFNNVARNKDATISGFEAELIANPWEGWEFMFGMGYLDTEAEDIDSERPFDFLNPVPLGPAIRDRELALSPDLTFNGLIRYEWEIFDGVMAVQTDFTYTGEQYFDIDNNPVSLEEDYIVTNARLSYASGDEHWSFDLSVKNITDEDYRVYAIPIPALCGCGQNMYGKPRWVSATVRYSW